MLGLARATPLENNPCLIKNLQTAMPHEKGSMWPRDLGKHRSEIYRSSQRYWVQYPADLGDTYRRLRYRRPN